MEFRTDGLASPTGKSHWRHSTKSTTKRYAVYRRLANPVINSERR
jgi:hypothetical protein